MTDAKKWTVVLVQVPMEGTIRTVNKAWDGQWISFKPPIGLLSIATTVRDRMVDADVHIIDSQAQRFGIRETVDAVVALQPDVVGISAWTDSWWAAHEIGREAKERLPETHLCYGGPHVGIFPAETLACNFVDSIICGDGEIPFASLCEKLKYLGIWGGGGTIPGVYTRDTCRNGVIYFTTPVLDDLPIPNRSLLDTGLYRSVFAKEEKITTMVTTRGCPNACIYCKLNATRLKSRSAEKVIEEFRGIRELGIKEVEVYDDTFTWSKERVTKICRAMIRENMQIRWAIRDRVNNADRELLKLMHDAGCIRVSYGIESGVEKIQKVMKKNISLEQCRNAVKWAREAGIETTTFFMFGMLEETVADMSESIRFARELDADYSGFLIVTPFPGTELYERALKTGIIPHDFWREFAKNPIRDFMVPNVIEDKATLDELLAIQRKAIRSFYMRPSYLWRNLKKVGGLKEFYRKASIGTKVLMAGLAK